MVTKEVWQALQRMPPSRTSTPPKRLTRVKASGLKSNSIETAVDGAVKNLSKASKGSLVVYGDPRAVRPR